MYESEDDSKGNAPSPVQIFLHRLQMRYQSFLDKVTPHMVPRWIATFVFFLFYVVRVYALQGFHIISYGLGIYLLNLFIGFLTPRGDPELDDVIDAEPVLPTKRGEEFKPFMRRLPEFKFWVSGTRAILVSICCTLFSILDIPVFWPILVMYFIILFVLTMKRQILHMIKYRYIPFTYGKPHHPGKENKGKVIGK